MTEVLVSGKISSHSEELFERLAAGDTIEEAKNKANENFPPRTEGTLSQPVDGVVTVKIDLNYFILGHKSDKAARLKKVYGFGVVEDNELEAGDWYKIFSTLGTG